jgi:chemotaxis protein histidine kinase CheA
VPPRDREAPLRRLARTARWTALRLRIDQTVARAFLLLPVPLLYAVAALTFVKMRRPADDTIETLLLLGLVPLGVLVVGTAHAWLSSRPKHIGALALDRHHGLHDRITSALAFTELPQSERTPLMVAAIDDAVETAKKLEPRRAAPLHFPRELPIVALLVGGLVVIALLEVRTTKVIPPLKTIEPMVMNPDDIDLFRDMAKELEQKSKDPEVQTAVRRFNQLVEDIAERRLDRTEVFKRLEELERDLMKAAAADKEAQEEGLKQLAEELEKSNLTKPIAEQLKQKNLADAEKAMRDLAEKLKNKKNPPTKAELDKLRDAVKKASQKSSENLKKIEEQRKKLEEEQKSLLKKKQEQDGGLSESDKSLLKKKDRQLERLDREKDQAKRSQRQLSKLDRELAKAAEDLLKEMGASAEDFEQAAQDINRMSQEEMTEQEKEELRRRLQELRELMRQQGKGGKERMMRLMKFGQKARGQKEGEGDGQNGKGMRTGGKGGDIMIGPPGSGGKSIPMPGSGQGSGQGEGKGMGQGSGQGEGKGDQPGGGAGKGGESWGTGHDEGLKGEASHLKGSTKDVTAAAADTGEGGASSQVIYGAAQRGFVGHGYKKVYTDYKTVAERVMNEDQIPPGYRFYVQRYFQLIRPRE